MNKKSAVLTGPSLQYYSQGPHDPFSAPEWRFGAALGSPLGYRIGTCVALYAFSLSVSRATSTGRDDAKLHNSRGSAVILNNQSLVDVRSVSHEPPPSSALLGVGTVQTSGGHPGGTKCICVVGGRGTYRHTHIGRLGGNIAIPAKRATSSSR